MNERRKQKFEEVAEKSQFSLDGWSWRTSLHPFEYCAILRTCDSVGIQTSLITMTPAIISIKTLSGKRSSMGTRKMGRCIVFSCDLDICIQEVRKDFAQILGWARKLSSKVIWKRIIPVLLL